jgi:hypothetical protein
MGWELLPNHARIVDGLTFICCSKFKRAVIPMLFRLQEFILNQIDNQKWRYFDD